MDTIIELILRQKLQNIAWRKAGETLIASGYSKAHKCFKQRQYDMQFVLYQQLKTCHGLD